MHAPTTTDTSKLSPALQHIFAFAIESVPKSVRAGGSEVFTAGYLIKTIKHAAIPKPVPFSPFQVQRYFIPHVKADTGRADHST